MKILDKKNMTSYIFGIRQASCFSLSKMSNFEDVFGFCKKGTPYFDCVKADGFR